MVNDLGRGGGNLQPQQLSRKSRSKQKKINTERKHKSLSPEKRLANTLAQSMSSISKSFEKLDLVGHNRLVGRRKSRSQGRSADNQHNQKKQRRRSRPNTDQQQPKQKEVTIAKLGRFKFSVEVAKQFDEELTKSKESGNGNK